MIRATTKIYVLLGWPAAMVIAAIAVVTEFLPFGFYRLNIYVSDWLGLLYVTMHFIVVPLACVLHILWNTLGTIVLSSRFGIRTNIIVVLSIIPAVTYLVLLYLWQLPFVALFQI